MPDTFNNIFLTSENLAFSMPLILVCATYVYFKYVPLHIALPLIGGAVVISQIQGLIKKQRDKKLTKLDEGTIQKLVGELESENDTENDTAEVTRKAKNKVQARLAQERKAELRKASQGKKGKKLDDDEDEDDLSTFAGKKVK